MKILIVGQGYAGSMLAWNLLKSGASVTIADRNDSDGSTRVSAGIMLPVTGRRLAKTQNADFIIPFAQHYYEELEKELGVSFFTRKDVLQIFSSIANKNEWYSRSADPGMENYVGDVLTSNQVSPNIKNEFGAILLKQSGFVRPSLFLDTLRNYFTEQKLIVECHLDHSELTFIDNGVQWRNEIYDLVVFCEGHHSRNHLLFGYLPFNPAKGEILDFESQNLPDDWIIVHGAYIVPLGDGRFRTGSTYEWKELNSIPTEQGRILLEDNLKTIINCDYKITAHKAGVRPSVKDRRPLLGFHPKFRQAAIFNGLGTKGAMQGPYYARQMCDYILEGKMPDADVNIKRFEALYQAH